MPDGSIAQRCPFEGIENAVLIGSAHHILPVGVKERGGSGKVGIVCFALDQGNLPGTHQGKGGGIEFDDANGNVISITGALRTCREVDRPIGGVIDRRGPDASPDASSRHTVVGMHDAASGRVQRKELPSDQFTTDAFAGRCGPDIDGVVDDQGRVPQEGVGVGHPQEGMPEHVPIGGVEGVELVIGSPDVDHPIDDCRAADDAHRTDRGTLGDAPAQLL